MGFIEGSVDRLNGLSNAPDGMGSNHPRGQELSDRQRTRCRWRHRRFLPGLRLVVGRTVLLIRGARESPTADNNRGGQHERQEEDDYGKPGEPATAAAHEVASENADEEHYEPHRDDRKARPQRSGVKPRGRWLAAWLWGGICR